LGVRKFPLFISQRERRFAENWISFFYQKPLNNGGIFVFLLIVLHIIIIVIIIIILLLFIIIIIKNICKAPKSKLGASGRSAIYR